MFEKIFNHGEQPKEIKEPEEQAETQSAVGEIDPRTGVVLTKKEATEKREKNIEDPTRYRDLR
ncbi:MAG: hypothetical protein ABIH10_00915 [Spirochaetota bacterium]